MQQRTEYYGAPLIEPSLDEITVKANEPFTLRCNSNSNITWVIVQPETGKINTSLDVQYRVNESSYYSYGADLEFSSVSVRNVSYYYCVKEQYLALAELQVDLMNEERNFHATKIYLFVEGKTIFDR